MIPPFANTGWPKYRVVTTAERVALQANQAQINNLPVGFILEEIDLNGELTALWIRNDETPGSLRRLQIIPQTNSVTVASLGADLVYVEEYDTPADSDGPRVVLLNEARRSARLVGALMISSAVDPPRSGSSVVTVENPGGIALVTFDIGGAVTRGDVVPPSTYDLLTALEDAQVTPGQFPYLNFTQGDVGFRLVLTWKVVA
jgi:hypothetical protein